MRGGKRISTILLGVAVVMVVAGRGEGQGMDDAISYTVRLPAPQNHRVEVEAAIPTGGARGRRADDGGVDAGVVPGAGVLAAGGDAGGRGAGRERAGGRQDEQEPLAGGDRRGGRGALALPAVLPRAVGADQLRRRRVRAAQRRRDVPHAGGRRGRRRPGRTACASSCRRAGRRRSCRCRRTDGGVRRGGLRRAGGRADLCRLAGDRPLPVRRRRAAAERKSCWSTRAAARCGTTRGRGATSERIVEHRGGAVGRRCRSSATSSST